MVLEVRQALCMKEEQVVLSDAVDAFSQESQRAKNLRKGAPRLGLSGSVATTLQALHACFQAVFAVDVR